MRLAIATMIPASFGRTSGSAAGLPVVEPPGELPDLVAGGDGEPAGQVRVALADLPELDDQGTVP
jgi:hypothetical protein